MKSGSKLAVAAAITGNSLTMISKFVTFLITGSGAMLSEAIHSLADTINQILLMIGVVRATRDPDPRFPYGYHSEKPVWALISAVGIFFLGCGVTVYHGVSNLIQPHEIGELGWAFGVLGLSLVLEGSVLAIALHSVYKAAQGRPFLSYLSREADVATVAVVMEDSAACLGIFIAFFGILLTQLTGEPAWDAVGSILIGLLLGAVAIWLIYRNHHLLLGPAIPDDVRARVEEALAKSPLVEKVVRLRTRLLDSETFRVAADLEFDGAVLATRLESELREAYAQIDSYEEFEAFARRFADEVVEQLGDEIDRLEAMVQRIDPRVRYLDLEAD